MANEDALTAEEVAERLRVSKSMVYELRNRGELAGYTVGRKLRFSASDVQRYIDSQHDQYALPFSSQERGQQADRRTVPLAEALPNPYGPTRGASRNSFIVNGTDAVIDVLSNYLIQMDVAMHRVYLTGYEGLISMYRDEANATSAHLWDGEENSYNASYVKRLVPGVPCALIHIATRMQGLVVAKGNPKKLHTWNDLLQPGLRIAHHERGSGARILLDEHLRLLGVDPSTKLEHGDVSHSPILLAGRVARKTIDVLIGTEKMARQVVGVEFVPLQRERIDLVVRQRDLTTLPVRALLNVMESGLLRADIKGFIGLNTSDMGRITLL